MNGYDMRIIRLIFKICYYYVMSFLVTPITFSSSVIDSVKEKLGQTRVTRDYVSYSHLISQNISHLRKLLVENYEDNLSDRSESEHNETEQKICERCSCESIFSEESEPDESLFEEFQEDGKTYSLKVDTIGKYDLRRSDIFDGSGEERSHIHINLKRKTVDIVGQGGTNRLPLRQNQIVVSEKEST
jgi:hypothetical protein